MIFTDHAACSTPFDLSKRNKKRSFASGSLTPMMRLQLAKLSTSTNPHYTCCTDGIMNVLITLAIIEATQFSKPQQDAKSQSVTYYSEIISSESWCFDL